MQPPQNLRALFLRRPPETGERALGSGDAVPRVLLTWFWLPIFIQGEARMNTITKHYIDGAFIESHGREVMDIINPTNG